MHVLKVKKLFDTASLPEYGSVGSIGVDLRAHLIDQHDKPCTRIMGSGHRYLVKTGLAAAIPEGYYGRIAPRSGLALEHGIDVMAGVIDSDYRGEIGILLVNHDSKQFVINHGDRVAQLILERADCMAIMLDKELDETDRGGRGFGSTGKE